MNEVEQSAPGKGLSIAGMVIGIISLLLSIFPMTSIIGIIAAIVGLILSVKARKIQKNGMATAGLVLSIIAIILGIITLVFSGLILALLVGTPEGNEVIDNINYYTH